MNTIVRVMFHLREIFERRVYRHHKGKYYCVLTYDAYSHDTEVSQTIYVSLDTGIVYTRPTDEFLGTYKNIKGNYVKRFRKVSKKYFPKKPS